MYDWKLAGFEPGVGLEQGAHTADYDDADWLPVQVPGDVHQALIAGGIIEDPFYDRNEDECGWIEDKEWWYRTELVRPHLPLDDDERMLLVFDGLDTYVTIYLNGEAIGEHRNMFRPAEFDVTQRLRPGVPYALALCFHRPLDFVAGFDTSHWWQDDAPRVAMRKAQFGYGWDWGPRLPTIGIWRRVHLKRQRKAVITGVHFYTLEITPKVAVVAVKVETSQFAGKEDLSVRVSLADQGAVKAAAERPAGSVNGDAGETVYLLVDDPKLWWTHDLGDPHLYDLNVSLIAAGELVDERMQQVGIRTITLDQSPDTQEPGARFFRFVLNGVPIFAKGANWIPAHSFVGGIGADRYEKLIGMARDANMNMLRVWGGGIYEHDVFYDLCDRMGILVWQDFMFACAMYPEGPEWFVREVALEAEYQVRRLRSHPSMALWCGNNENQWLHERTFWRLGHPIVPGALYYDMVIPEAVAKWDGQIAYWPGSPYGGDDYNSELDGDSHNWNAWHGNSPRRFGEEPKVDHTPKGVSYRRYGEDMTRFCSEFGMHAAPVLETLERNIPPDQLYHHSPAMDHHNKDNPKNKGDSLMLSVTGLPETLAQYIDFSMAAQAEGLKYGIEHYRRRKPHCSGTLFWQLNDCWPVLSWSVIDYYGAGKAGYYYARRAYTPVLASVQECDNGDYALWVTNDTLEETAEQLDVRLVSFAGKELWGMALEVTLAPNSSQEVWRGRIEGDNDRYLSMRGRNVMANRTFFAPIKQLRLPPVTLSVTVNRIDSHALEVTLRADKFAYFVHLSTGMPTTTYSDNYFDLEPGADKTVFVTDSAFELDAGELSVQSYVEQPREIIIKQ